MIKMLMWLRMLLKRQMKKVSIYIILVIMATVSFLLKYVADNFSVSIEIGIVNADSGEMAKAIEQEMRYKESIIGFRMFEDKEELLQAVRSGEVMGGYIFNAGFSEKLLSGDIIEAVEVLATPTNIIAKITNEVVFSIIMKELSYETLVSDTVDTSLFEKFTLDEIREELRQYYELNLSNGSTFSIKYNKESDELQDKVVNIDTYDYISPIIVGILGLLIFVAGLCGTISYYDDRDTGALCLLKENNKQLISVIQIAIPVIISSVISWGLLYGLSLEADGIYLARKLLVYSFIVILYCFALKTVVKNKHTYIGLIPIFILLCLIFCPIFINISSLVPNTVYISKLLPVYYLYLI